MTSAVLSWLSYMQWLFNHCICPIWHKKRIWKGLDLGGNLKRNKTDNRKILIKLIDIITVRQSTLTDNSNKLKQADRKSSGNNLVTLFQNANLRTIRKMSSINSTETWKTTGEIDIIEKFKRLSLIFLGKLREKTTEVIKNDWSVVFEVLFERLTIIDELSIIKNLVMTDRKVS